MSAKTFNFTGENSLENMTKGNQVPEAIGQQYNFLDLYSTLTPQQRINVSTDIDQFLIDCTFDGAYCSKR